MDKNKIIAQLFALLKDADAAQCDLVLTFVEHMTDKARDDKVGGKTFTFTTPDAIEIAYIVQRNKESDTFLNKLLIQAASLERLYSSPSSSKK